MKIPLPPVPLPEKIVAVAQEYADGTKTPVEPRNAATVVLMRPGAGGDIDDAVDLDPAARDMDDLHRGGMRFVWRGVGVDGGRNVRRLGLHGEGQGGQCCRGKQISHPILP